MGCFTSGVFTLFLMFVFFVLYALVFSWLGMDGPVAGALALVLGIATPIVMLVNGNKN